MFLKKFCGISSVFHEPICEWNTEEIQHKCKNVHLYFSPKKTHNITVLSSDCTHFFSSNPVKKDLRLEKEKLKKWIFQIKRNVSNSNTYVNIQSDHTCITIYRTL